MLEASAGTTFALALGAGVAGQLLARHTRVPSIVLLLALGVALGPDGAGIVRPETLGEGLFALVSLAVAVILFEGGLNLDLARIRREGAPIRRLLTLGAAVTAIGGGLAAHAFMGWGWGKAFLFGTLVIVTGPTVIRPLLRNVPLRPRLATVLEAEGLLIDPVGAIVAAVALPFALGPALDMESFASGAAGLLLRLGFGAAAGVAAGLALVGLLRLRHAVPEGFENLVALGGALLTFEACESVLTESGILAVTAAGTVVGNLETRLRRELGEFQEHLTVGLIGLLFVLLAADVRLGDVVGLGAAGIATVAALALAVRPVGVALCTWGSELDWRERAFLCWVAPRGVVAAAIASIAAAFFGALGVPGGDELRALVFLTIGVTVVLQGGTAPLVARGLGVRAPGRESVVLLGAEELAFALGEILRDGGERVVFADSNPMHCRVAQARGFSVVYGNVLEESTLRRLRLERARAAVGLTANNEVNHHFAGLAREEFAVPGCYVAVNPSRSDVAERIVERQESFVLFDRVKDVERWNVRLRHGAVDLRAFRFAGAPRDAGTTEGESAPAGPRGARGRGESAREAHDPFILVAVRRGGRWEPMRVGLEPAEGDAAMVAIHRPEERAALDVLGALGWEPAPAEAPDAKAKADEEGSGPTA